MELIPIAHRVMILVSASSAFAVGIATHRDTEDGG